MKIELKIRKATNGNFILWKGDSKPIIYETINELILNEFLSTDARKTLQTKDFLIIKFELEIE